MTGLKRNTETVMGTDVNAVNTSHPEKIGAKEIRNIPGSDMTGRTRSQGPAAVRRVGTEVGTAVLAVTAIDDTTADLTTIHALVLIHQKSANLGHRSMLIHHPIRHVVLALELPPDITKRRLLQHS